jgi:predicted XRE-type DNA-binding protein
MERRLLHVSQRAIEQVEKGKCEKGNLGLKLLDFLSRRETRKIGKSRI